MGAISSLSIPVLDYELGFDKDSYPQKGSCYRKNNNLYLIYVRIFEPVTKYLGTNKLGIISYTVYYAKPFIKTVNTERR